MTPTTESRARARKIVDESARFNSTPARAQFRRTLNVPLMALRFLRRPNVARSTWQLGSRSLVDGRQIQIVRFREQATPRLIGSNDGTAATGAFWLDEASGAVVRSEFGMKNPRITATIEVAYAEHPTIKLWLPQSMNERYSLSAGLPLLVVGDATYSNFRRFTVETSTTIK
jgi:hypothetical protein